LKHKKKKGICREKEADMKKEKGENISENKEENLKSTDVCVFFSCYR
jgi:hypothetical protein